MYFDPLSPWLVALIADGIVDAGEEAHDCAATGYDPTRAIQVNEILNNDIRRVRNKYGLSLPQKAYEQIQFYIRSTKNSFPFQYDHGQIMIDFDNQEYIITLLEACSIWHSKFSQVRDEAKAKWYEAAALEARRRKEIYMSELEEIHAKEAARREREQAVRNFFLFLIFILLMVFMLLYFC